jgi:hypothetical protein
VSEQTTAKQVAVVCFRVLSVHFLLMAVPLALFSFRPWGGPTVLAAALLIAVLLLAISLSLWRFAPILPDVLLNIDEHILDTRGIAVLALRVVGLYIVFTQLPAVLMPLVMIADMGAEAWRAFIPPLLYVGAGLFVWRYSESLGARLSRGLGAIESPSPITAGGVDVQTLAFSVVGLFVLAHAVPSLISAGATSLLAPRMDLEASGFPVMLDSVDISRVLMNTAQLAIGAALLFGARGFSGMIRRFRDYGLILDEKELQS